MNNQFVRTALYPDWLDLSEKEWNERKHKVHSPAQKDDAGNTIKPVVSEAEHLVAAHRVEAEKMAIQNSVERIVRLSKDFETDKRILPETEQKVRQQSRRSFELRADEFSAVIVETHGLQDKYGLTLPYDKIKKEHAKLLSPAARAIVEQAYSAKKTEKQEKKEKEKEKK